MAKQKSVDLVQKVVDEVRETQAQYGYGNLGDAFTRWCVERLEGLESSEAEEACEVQGSGDKSLDFHAKNDKAALLTLGQCKFSESGNYQVSRQEVADFFGLPARLQSPSATAKAAFKEAAQSYQEAIAQGYQVQLKFFVFGSLSPDGGEEVKHQKPKLPQNHEFILLDLQEILTLLELQPVPPQVLAIAPGQVFTRNTDALVASVKAKDLIQVYRNLGDKLFAVNPRLYLGKGKAVNKELLTTLDPQKEPDGHARFWYYNNGITAICKDFKVDHPGENQVTVQDLRVVNGCQTIRTLREKDREARVGDEVHILFRLVKTERGDFPGQISRRTNRQTAIKARDLVSDDDEQRRIQNEFQKEYPSYFYERKQGEWREFTIGQKRQYKAAVVTSVGAGRAFLAFFSDDPSQMVIIPEEDLCDVDEQTYKTVFKNTPAIKLLVPALLKQGLDKLRSQFAQGTQQTDKEAYALLKKDIAKAFAIGIIGRLFREKHPQDKDLAGALKRLLNQWETVPGLPANLCKMAVFGLLSALGHRLREEKKLAPDKTLEDFPGLLPYLREPGKFDLIYNLRRSFILAAAGGVDPIAQLLP